MESHLAEIIWLEPKPERIAGIWIDPNWLADNAEDGKQHTNAVWHTGAREAPRETVVAQLLAFSLPICARDDGFEVLTGEPFRDIQAYLERFIAASAARNQNEARRDGRVAGEKYLAAANGPRSRRLIVERTI